MTINNTYNKQQTLLLFFIITFTLLFTLKSHSQEFINNYQYDYIDQLFQEKEEAELTKLLNQNKTNSLSDIQQYFLQHNIAYIYFKKRDKKQTLKYINQAISLVKNNQHPYHLAKSLLLRAKTYGILFRDTKTAIKDLQQAFNVNKQSKHAQKNNLTFDLQTAMAQAYNQLGELSKAQHYIEQALITVKTLNNNNETIHALIIAGRIAFQQDHFKQAYQTYLKALALSDETTSKKQIASIELRLAIAYESQGVYQQALKHAQRAVDLYHFINNKILQIKALRVLGNIYLEKNNDVNMALVHFFNALDIAKAAHSEVYQGQILYLIGKSYLKEKQFDKAKQYLNNAQILLKQVNSTFYTALNTLELAKLAEHNKQPHQAISLLTQLKSQYNLEKYPSLMQEINDYLLPLLVNAEKFKQAYQVAQEQLTQNKDLQKKQSKQMIPIFDHNIKISSLQKEIKSLKNAQQNSEQKNKDLTDEKRIYIITILGLVIFCLVMYQLMKKWQIRYLKRLQQSFLTWLALKKQLKREVKITSNSGMLVCHLNAQALNKLHINELPASHILLKLAYQGNISRYRNLFWCYSHESLNNIKTQLHYCNGQPQLTVKQTTKQALKQEKTLLNEQHHLIENINKNTNENKMLQENIFSTLLYFNLENFPNKLSDESFKIIEVLSLYLKTQHQHSNKMLSTTIEVITITDKAFPLLAQKHQQPLIELIETAIMQGLITIEPHTF